MHLINCEINFNLTWYGDLTLPTQDIVKLLRQQESGFKIKISWNK